MPLASRAREYRLGIRVVTELANQRARIHRYLRQAIFCQHMACERISGGFLLGHARPEVGIECVEIRRHRPNPLHLERSRVLGAETFHGIAEHLPSRHGAFLGLDSHNQGRDNLQGPELKSSGPEPA